MKRNFLAEFLVSLCWGHIFRGILICLLVLTQLFFIVWFLKFLSAPLASGDSRVFLDFVSRWGPGKAEWHPMGMSILYDFWSRLFGPRYLGFLLLSVLFKQLLIVVLLKGSGFSWLFSLICSFLFLLPSWWVIHSTLWSENLAIIFLLVMALIFQKAQKSFHKKISLVPTILVLGISFFFSLQVRHASVFFLPALLLVLFLFLKNFYSYLKAALIALTMIVPFFLSNLFSSFHLLKPSRGGAYSCVQAVISLNYISFCPGPAGSWVEVLCSLDPEQKFLGQKNLDGHSELSGLHFLPESPYNQFFRRFGADRVCHLYREQMNLIFKEHKKEFFLKFFHRLWAFYGGWDSHEFAPPLDASLIQENRKKVEEILNFQNINRPFWRHLVWGGALLLASLFLVKKVLPPLEVLFLFFASVFHSAGLALNNPFTALRYMEIGVSSLLLSLLLAVAFVLKIKKRVS